MCRDYVDFFVKDVIDHNIIMRHAVQSVGDTAVATTAEKTPDPPKTVRKDQGGNN